MLEDLSKGAALNGFVKTLLCSNYILEAFGAESSFLFHLLLG